MQAVRLPGEALTLSLAAALLCSGCTPLPPGDQSASASQVSTVSTSLSQVSSLRGALDRLEPEADCLVLASGGEYYRFERNGVDVSGLIPGDPGHGHLYRGTGPRGGHRLCGPALYHQGTLKAWTAASTGGMRPFFYRLLLTSEAGPPG